MIDNYGKTSYRTDLTIDTTFIDLQSGTLGIMVGQEEIEIPAGRFVASEFHILQRENSKNVTDTSPGNSITQLFLKPGM